MDDDELRYAATEQIMVASGICSLCAGTGAILQGFVIWPLLLVLGAATLAGAGWLHPSRRWSLRWGSLALGASVLVWGGLLAASAPRSEPVLPVIVLLGACSAGWASRFLHRAQHPQDHRNEPPAREPALRASEDHYARGVIEELPATTSR